VANLLLARLGARRREFALRAALGAGRLRIGRQVAADIALLAAAGGGGGLLVAAASLPLLDRLGMTSAWRWSGVAPGVGGAVALFAFALTLGFGVLLGVVASFALSRTGGYELLRSASRATPTQGAGRARSALVVAQFALTLVLLAAAGLLLKSFVRLQRTDPGFVAAGVLTMRLNLPDAAYAADADAVRYYDRLLTAARRIPGVETAAYTSSLPFDQHLGVSGYKAEGYAGEDAEMLAAERQSVDEDYFAALGMPLLEGRAFSAGDTAGSTPVVIVDETLAHHLWPGRSALGRRLRRDGDDTAWMTVVGVVPAVRQNDLARKPVLDAMYWPYRQLPARFGELVVRSALPAATLLPQLRAAALAVDAQLPLYDARTLDERIAHSLNQRRTPVLMLGAFAGLALLLAAIGLYGVVAFLTARRAAELGVRIAVGASARDVLALVLGSGLRLCAFGIAAGALGAFAVGRLLRAELYEVDAADPGVFAGVAALLVAVALLACWLPARRAAATDPAIALRDE
ncbi:MAG TPA: FtsX-like permease family protein, partial [Dokdonella sp.]